MTTQDKTQMVTIRVQVPTFSTKMAAQRYLPVIIDAIEGVEIPEPDANARALGLRIRGASVGTVR